MISVHEAKKIIKQNLPEPLNEVLPLNSITGRVITQDIASPLELPLFDNSAMDGYVLRAADTLEVPLSLKIKGVIKAGDTEIPNLFTGDAYKIMTGAVIPEGGDTILIQEEANVDGDQLIIKTPVKGNLHIRKKGEELKVGAAVLNKGQLVMPGTVSYLATIGLKEASVFQTPRVAIIATGSELIEPGQELQTGQIYDSNSYLLESALKQQGITPTIYRSVGDDKTELSSVISKALAESDLIILSGGISVGAYDYVQECLDANGIEKLFWRVAQKPGKPLYFGKSKDGQKIVFGLPGNPAAVFTCYYEYVYPAIQNLKGIKDGELNELSLPMPSEVSIGN